ncbi:MAG TPA: hypothetical protein VKB78_00180, partial [Pirellulales bacterium]|nr:hypothetical protein [Pirellulales bacterium]
MHSGFWKAFVYPIGVGRGNGVGQPDIEDGLVAQPTPDNRWGFIKMWNTALRIKVGSVSNC